MAPRSSASDAPARSGWSWADVLEPGDRVGDYVVEREVGAGSIGHVYRVHHVARGTLHALKFVATPGERARARLNREAAVLQRLSHPNVVTLTEVLEINGEPALVLEYVDGPTLATWAAAEDRSLAEIETLFRGIVAGVAHLHRRGLVHRDLRPQNVLLAPTSDGLVPKVADFGLAKVLDPAMGTVYPATQMNLGAPGYAAPEQLRDARSVDAGADIFSLGCILYELVCRRPAFTGSDLLTMMNATARGRFKDPKAVRPELPERFAVVIRACLEPDRDRRIASCDELLRVLGDGLEPVRRELTPARRVPTESMLEVVEVPPPTWQLVGVAAIMLLVTVGLGGWWLWG